MNIFTYALDVFHDDQARKRRPLHEIPLSEMNAFQRRIFKRDLLSAYPTSVEAYLMQYVLGGGKLNTQDVERETGLRKNDLPNWTHQSGATVSDLIDSIRCDFPHFGERAGAWDDIDIRDDLISTIASLVPDTTGLIEQLRGRLGL